jgi:hypothetical protein
MHYYYHYILFAIVMITIIDKYPYIKYIYIYLGKL